jgi:LmbE family N-acetylglucosaminyl deacetylase
MDDWKRELTGRTLLVVAHADDESVAFGALLQKMREAVVVIVTDGAPRDEYFWGRFGSRDNYRAVRREEARRATELAGVCELALLAVEDERLEDQRLFLNLGAAWARLERLAERVRPEAIATLAYEGGHPDHDSCSLLAARLGERLAVPVWEAPVYWRENGGAVHSAAGDGGQLRAGEEGTLRVQRFIRESGDEVGVEMSEAELERKLAMCAEYRSQGNFLRTFDVRREVLRPQVKYDYTKAPHVGRTNYEQWQWWMSAREVCAKFAEFLEVRS